MQATSSSSNENDHPKAKLIRPILRRLNSISSDIEASAVISGDGLSIAAVLGDGVDPDRFGAMCASLLALADRTAKEISRGDLKQVLVEGTTGSMLVVRISEKAVLAVAARPTVNLGRVFLEARKVANLIGENIIK
jgi:predicted regulator of Ras-like GTPase activity (Roadblock/LC7/MglB family)